MLDFKKIISYFNFYNENGKKIEVLRDWKIFLAISLILFFLCLLINGYIFWNYEKEQAPENIVFEREFRVNNKILEDMVKKITEREEKFNATIPPVNIKDPSI